MATMRNITVDDANSTLIVYHPTECNGSGWTLNTQRGTNGTYRYCTRNSSEGLSAEISFKGVAIYYRSPAFEGASMQIRLDGVRTGDIDLSTPPGVNLTRSASRVVWGRENLQNEEHTLELFPGSNSTTLNVDAFIITEVDSSLSSANQTTTLISKPTSPGGPLSAASSESHATNNRVALGIGITFGVISFFIFLCISFFLTRRRNELNRNYGTREPPPLPVEPPTSFHADSGFRTHDSFARPYESVHSLVNSPVMKNAALPMARTLPPTPQGMQATIDDMESYDGHNAPPREWSSPVPSTSALLRQGTQSTTHGYGGGYPQATVSRNTTTSSKLIPLRRPSSPVP